ncbi:MAG: ABC-F family ATP-binding cassette domain-containing protein [Cyclobacteriaceae bacterium]|nr:ABC-F family ATP-binding cassette domain-containing protein [Cyclobacteriaceae bacterium]MCH8515608.1 ABC-F family ATP-binding cassette domain-containing protein [Cyclobacteriaceae bacterium]
MIAINNLDYVLGDRYLYDAASLHIKPGERIGLIGKNGTGKTTLLRLINGDYQVTGGEISKSKDCTIGFLNQDMLSYQSDKSILEVALEAFDEVLELQSKIDSVLAEMEANYHESQVDRLTSLQERYETLGGYTLKSKAEEILEGIGFKTIELERPLRTFSGGWRMRVMLAKLLLQQPSLLMLDEPTNHLDLPSIEWVENYLRTYSGAVIVVSHDREFLNRTINRIVEVEFAKLNVYEGDYNNYLEEKGLRQEIQKNAFENQQKQIKQTERFIERFRSKATKARQVQSRVKALDKLDRVEDVVHDNAAVNFSFDFKTPSGKEVITLDQVGKAYGENVILKNTSAQIRRGDKIALIGANGKGKSTLLRIIAGDDPSHEGNRKEGHNVIQTFYAQHQLEALTVDNEILDELKQSGSGRSETELRNVLGCFLFTDDDVYKKIKVLSGGEKSRVALAKTLLSEANFLLLDEPTNHLDFQSVNILIQALSQYQGSYVAVSHDRYFIERIANKIWYIEDLEIKEYPGTYLEFKEWQREKEADEKLLKQLEEEEIKKNKPKPQKNAPTKQAKPDAHLKRAIEKIEIEIESLESRVSEIESDLTNPEIYEDENRLKEKNKEYTSVKSELAAKSKEWEELLEKI